MLVCSQRWPPFQEAEAGSEKCSYAPVPYRVGATAQTSPWLTDLRGKPSLPRIAGCPAWSAGWPVKVTQIDVVGDGGVEPQCLWALVSGSHKEGREQEQGAL